MIYDIIAPDGRTMVSYFGTETPLHVGELFSYDYFGSIPNRDWLYKVFRIKEIKHVYSKSSVNTKVFLENIDTKSL